jgi:hypothetical protein
LLYLSNCIIVMPKFISLGGGGGLFGCATCAVVQRKMLVALYSHISKNKLAAMLVKPLMLYIVDNVLYTEYQQSSTHGAFSPMVAPQYS